MNDKSMTWMSRSDTQYERILSDSEAGGRSASTASPCEKELVKHSLAEPSGSQGETQILRMAVRLYCERGEVKFLGLSKMDGERKVRR